MYIILYILRVLCVYYIIHIEGIVCILYYIIHIEGIVCILYYTY